MARVVKGSHSCTLVYPRMELTLFVFAFPTEAGSYLPTQYGWKAELAQAP